MTFDELCDRHRRIALDSNLLIYLFEVGGPGSRAVQRLLDAAEAGSGSLVVASLALAEISVYPAAIDNAVMAERYADAIRSVPRLDVVPLTAEIALEAGLMRGRHGHSLPDAIHLATAVRAGASVFVTNDRRLRAIPRLEVVQLADLVA
ncbi:MAG TPA: type II toxin-antitoxin system VapC family toxin [Patescibacteria group bacterium]|nr:type II toxin-antitoxin system VapC family toxin [Patescibacteria group bacterium]